MNTYSANDYRYYLQHSWGTSPAQKLREKEYNKAYYEAHKSKWGIKDQKALVKDVKKSFNRFSTFNQGVDKLKNNSAIQQSYGELRDSFNTMRDCEEKLTKAAKEFKDNKELYKAYAKKTADAEVERYKKLYPNSATKEALQSIRDYYENVEGIDADDQIWFRYRDDHKELDDLSTKHFDAQREFIQDSRRVANELLKEYGDMKVTYRSQFSRDKINGSIENAVEAAIREVAKVKLQEERESNKPTKEVERLSKEYAEKLSGEDFDGKTPNNWNKELSKQSLSKQSNEIVDAYAKADYKEAERKSKDLAKELSKADFDGDKWNRELIKQNLSKQNTTKKEKSNELAPWKKEALQNARQKDQFQINFLEAIQNDDDLLDNRQRMLKEYEKYLEDPEKYMQTH